METEASPSIPAEVRQQLADRARQVLHLVEEARSARACETAAVVAHDLGTDLESVALALLHTEEQ